MKMSFPGGDASPKPEHLDSLSIKTPKETVSHDEQSPAQVHSDEEAPKSFEEELEQKVSDKSDQTKGTGDDSAGAAMLSIQKPNTEKTEPQKDDTEGFLEEGMSTLLSEDGGQVLKKAVDSLAGESKEGMEKDARANLTDGKNLTSLQEKKSLENFKPTLADRVQIPSDAVDATTVKKVLPDFFLKESALKWQMQLERAEIGIKNAFQEDMTKTSPGRPGVEAREGIPDEKAVFNQSIPNFRTNQAETLSVEKPSDLLNLMDRVQRALDSKILQQPRHLVIQLDPPSLGRVEIHLARSADCWNVDWSVSRPEIKEWLALQLPSFQRGQKESEVPIVWNAPVLQNSTDDSRKGHTSSDHMNANELLWDEADTQETKVGSAHSSGSRGYWA